MNIVKQAWWIASFELKASVKNLIFMLLLTVFYSGFFAFVYSENGVDIVLDIFFILNFWLMTVWLRPKEFQYQKINEGFWASPYVLMLRKLPISKHVLVLSRFITYLTFSIPYNVFILLWFYLFSNDLREAMSLGTYISFSIIWICFGIVFGGIFPASDVGDQLKSKMWIYGLYSVLLFGGLLGIIIAIFTYSDRGVVAWSIYFTSEWPAISIIFSIIIMITILLYYRNYSYKKIDENDYIK